MKLVFVALGRGAAFEIADIRAGVGDDQRAFELAGFLFVDAEVGRELHRAAHALGHINERAIGVDCGVQRREVIVGDGHDRTKILAHQFRMRLHGFGNRAKDHAGLGQLFLEGRRDRHGVKHCVDSHFAGFDAGENFLLAQRNAELLIGAQ